MATRRERADFSVPDVNRLHPETSSPRELPKCFNTTTRALRTENPPLTSRTQPQRGNGLPSCWFEKVPDNDFLFQNCRPVESHPHHSDGPSQNQYAISSFTDVHGFQPLDNEVYSRTPRCHRIMGLGEVGAAQEFDDIWHLR